LRRIGENKVTVFATTVILDPDPPYLDVHSK